MSYLNLGAIDIGSNSIRLLICQVVSEAGQTHFKKVAVTRLPVRLGADVFTAGQISPETGDRLVDAMRAFAAIMRVHGVADYRACATSAMREAGNAAEWIGQVEREAGIQIEVIGGDEEARLIAHAGLLDQLTTVDPNLCYVDVGGGSTELTFMHDGEPEASRSFPLGTLRSMDTLDGDRVWKDLRAWVEGQAERTRGGLALVGTGGNINKAHKLSGRKVSEPLSKQYLDRLSKQLSRMTNEERVVELGLTRDRADVIVPALRIYRRVMRWTHATWIYVPRVGVSDGMVRELYFRKHPGGALTTGDGPLGA